MRTLIACMFCCFLAACQFDAAGKSRALAALTAAHNAHEITDAQFAAGVEAIDTGPANFNWGGIADLGIKLLLAALGIPILAGGSTAAVLHVRRRHTLKVLKDSKAA